jgi:hypothetical protein
MTAPVYCERCEAMTHPTLPHSCFSAAMLRAYKDAERAVKELCDECGYYRCTCLSILTPEMAAVIEAAKAQKTAAEALQRHTCDDWTCLHYVKYIGACTRTEAAVEALSAVEGDV